jgi:capsular polysaccharide biosynthesis protein
MRIVDVPPSIFCNAPEIGQHFVAGRNRQFRMFHFRDCRVDMRMLFPIVASGGEGRVCKAMFGMYEEQKYDEYFSGDFASRLPLDAPVDREFCFVLGGIRNYWHFLVDHLSKIALLPSFPESGLPMPAMVVNDTLTEDYLRLLEAGCALLGVQRPIIVMSPKRFTRFRNSYIPCVSPLGPRLDFLRDLGRAIQSSDAKDAPERIFIRRGGASHRRIENEGELERALAREFGFVALTAGDMTPFEQINAMKSARIVIAGHGAALTNIIFGVELKHVIELYVHATQPHYKAVCDHWGIAHHFVPGTSADPEARNPAVRRPDNQDYAVDVEAMLRLAGSLATQAP